MVEFALVSMLMLVFVLGVMDFGFLFAGRVSAYEATRVAVRYGAVHPVAWSAAASSSCTATGYTLYALSRTFNSFTKQYADCLTSSSIFTYVAPVAGASLAKVHAVITASVNPAKSVETFALQDDIVMRNSARA